MHGLEPQKKLKNYFKERCVMITNLKTTIKSTRQKRQDIARRKVWRQFVKNFDSYIVNIENTDNPKIKRMIELGKKHMQLKDIIKIVDQEFPEE